MGWASPPARGRELKSFVGNVLADAFRSPPARGRELKLTGKGENRIPESRPLRGGVN